MGTARSAERLTVNFFAKVELREKIRRKLIERSFFFCFFQVRNRVGGGDSREEEEWVSPGEYSFRCLDFEIENAKKAPSLLLEVIYHRTSSGIRSR